MKKCSVSSNPDDQSYTSYFVENQVFSARLFLDLSSPGAFLVLLT